MLCQMCLNGTVLAAGGCMIISFPLRQNALQMTLNTMEWRNARLILNERELTDIDALKMADERMAKRK